MYVLLHSFKVLVWVPTLNGFIDAMLVCISEGDTARVQIDGIMYDCFINKDACLELQQYAYNKYIENTPQPTVVKLKYAYVQYQETV